ncbi:MAG: NAD-dependent epimerase/dehydratase family protein [Planctomycetota bacterium]
MKIGITGVAGFIGSHLAQRLLEKGEEVIGVDNLSYGQLHNLSGFHPHPHFSFHALDILEEASLERILAPAEILIHLAALKIPRYENALGTLKTNTQGSENVLKIASKTKSKVLLASTSDVYGKSAQLPFEEEGDLVVGPPTVKRWAYAISKMYEEQLAFAYAEQYHFPVVLLRFFGGYGPRQHLSWWGGPQAVFIGKALRLEPLPIHGNGQQTRTFIFIQDLIDGILACIYKNESKDQVFNLGTEEEVSIEWLAKKIWSIVQPKEPPKLEYVPYTTFGKYEDVLRRKPSLEKAKTLLGFSPRIFLDEGLQRTFEWQKHLN